MLCEKEMAEVSRTEGIPLAVLYAVGLTESGRRGSLHPFALNIAGRTVFAASASEALTVFAEARSSGVKLIDLGCMQINHHYHGQHFDSPLEMLDPAKNVRYAATFLQQLRAREGSWAMAVARYHAGAGNIAAQKRYICLVIRNLVASGFGRWTPEARRFCW
jgi:soluble lytic murein transglycosylase-like protein